MDYTYQDSDEDDIQITKVLPAKKSSVGWVSSSFDNFSFGEQRLQQSQKTPYKREHSKPTSSSKTWKKSVSSTKSSIQDCFPVESLSRKRSREDSFKEFHTKPLRAAAQTWELWSDRYLPTHRSELAVHKKKVEEISDWLRKAALAQRKPILLLTGPPGAGKTACISVLCREMGFQVQEWQGRSEQAADQWMPTQERPDRSSVDVYESQSQSVVFTNFLLRASKYNALPVVGNQPSCSSAAHTSKTVVVVEELPNVFYRDSAQFHQVLRNYKSRGKSTLVFILSDSSIEKLFPRDLLQELNITNISMNPVAPTMLVKLLTKVASQEVGKSGKHPPSSAIIEDLALASGGDIRSALNSLQFACGKDTRDLNQVSLGVAAKPRGRLKYGSSNNKSGRSAGDKEESSTAGSTVGVKDKAIFLFQSVGKILHFKRGNPEEYPRVPALTSHLAHFYRDPLVINPEEVASKSQLSGDVLTSFLHENYVEFMSSVEDLERASEYFSDADCLSSLWTAREELQSYSVSVAIRGYIHSNSDRARHDSQHKSHGWLPLHKSRWFSASKQTSENITSAKQLFRGYHWEPEVLCTEILPYISLTNPTLHDPGQITFVQEMAMFSRSSQPARLHLERLRERDVADDEDCGTQLHRDQRKTEKLEDDPTDVLGSQSKIQSLQKDDEDNIGDEDVVIEEYDDDDDFGDFVF